MPYVEQLLRIVICSHFRRLELACNSNSAFCGGSKYLVLDLMSSSAVYVIEIFCCIAVYSIQCSDKPTKIIQLLIRAPSDQQAWPLSNQSQMPHPLVSYCRTELHPSLPPQRNVRQRSPYLSIPSRTGAPLHL